jgi:hypothetical protein
MVMNTGLKTAILLILGFVQMTAQNPNWTAPNGSGFEFSANYIATIHLAGVPSHDAEDAVAFFKDGEIRGLGNAISLGNGMYRHFITIYAHEAIDTLDIKVYHKNTDHVYEVQQPVIFQVQGITGNVDDPYVINIYPDNDAPIRLLPVPAQFTLEGFAFPAIDMSAYLVQPDQFPVAWTFTPNPNLIASFQGSILSVTDIAGFTGQTQLVIRATEQSMAMGLEGESYASRAVQNQQFADVTITFNVTSTYLPPLWEPVIPDQGILLGEQFDTIALYDFENQFQQPFIKYDYLPIIAEKAPPIAPPNWQITKTPETTMNVVTKVNYTPKYQFHHEDDVLAAFVGSEVVGIAYRNAINGLYYLSIGSNNINDSVVSIKLYSGAMKDTLVIDSVFLYQPYAIHGSAENPFIIDFAPIAPVVPDLPVADGIYDMPVNILDKKFVGSVAFRFFALDPTYPQYLYDQTNATFCIARNSSELTTYYQDADEDGLGNPSVSVLACSSVPGYVTNNSDCDDNGTLAPGINLSVAETSGTAPNDNKICSGSPVNITAAGGDSYLWSTGQTGSVISVNPTMTGSFTVTVTLTSGCSNSKSVNIFVEGTVVKNQDNAGDGSLRNVLECIAENGIITYDLPLINSTILTSPLIVNKNVSIHGTISLRPEIQVDFNQAAHGIEIQSNKNLILKNVDLISLQSNNNILIMGPGNLTISEQTKIRSN